MYKGINGTLINDIFDLLYTKRLNGALNVNLYTNSELQKVSSSHDGKGLHLSVLQHEQNQLFTLETEGAVLATGYHYQPPTFIEGIRQHIRWDNKGRYEVQRNYSIDRNNTILYRM